jgi:hypothetical protein
VSIRPRRKPYQTQYISTTEIQDAWRSNQYHRQTTEID